MDRKIRIEKTKEKDLDELMYHMAVQTLLDTKSIYGRIIKDDIRDAMNLSLACRSVFFGDHLAAVVFFVLSDDNKNTLNMFLYATTEGFSKIDKLKESLFGVINGLPKARFRSIVYKGNKKLQSVLRANGFEFNKNVCFGEENRNFCLFIRE